MYCYRLRMFDRLVVSLLFSLSISGVFFLLPFFADSTLAADLTGRDIALRMDAVDTSEDSKRTAIMIINRKGQKLVRKMESCNKKYGQDERGLIRFIEPPDVRGHVSHLELRGCGTG